MPKEKNIYKERNARRKKKYKERNARRKKTKNF